MDIGTGLALFGAKDIIIKLLGPSADYLGEQGKLLIQKSQTNIKNIFNHSIKLLGDKIETKGNVSPRILKEIINEGAYCDDEIVTEYFGGVLASSRSGIERDDRGLTMTSIIKSMSTYQLRAHYIFYSLIKNFYNGCSLNLGHFDDRRKLGVFIPTNSICKSMQTSKTENIQIIFSHILSGLDRYRLIHSKYAIGDPEFVQPYYEEAKENGLFVAPTIFGFELYMWAHGIADKPVQTFLNKELEIDFSENVILPDNAQFKILN